MNLFILILLFVVSAFFSATETALFSLRRVDLEQWKEEGNRRAAMIRKMLDNPGSLLSTVIIGGIIGNVAISSMLAAMLIPLMPRGYGEAAVVSLGTISILVFCDIAPKSIVWPRAKPFSLMVAPPLMAFSKAVAPLRFVFENASAGILFLLGVRGKSGDGEMISEAEFRAMIDIGEETGTIDPGEKELIHNIFEMTDKRAAGVMSPLPDVFMVPRSMPYDELAARYRLYRKSRIPVYEGERLNIVGVLHFKDLLRPMAESGSVSDWTKYIRRPFFAPSIKKLPLLLRDFQRKKVHLAVLVDEFGDPEGIITIEDILEELFGDIQEEHDREEKEIVPRPDGSSRVLGKTSIYRFNQTFGTNFPDEEWDTVAGLLLHEFGRLPAKNDHIVIGGLVVTVEKVKGVRIVEVGVRAQEEGEG